MELPGFGLAYAEAGAAVCDALRNSGSRITTFRDLRYAARVCATHFWTPDNNILGASHGIFAEFMKYAGKFLRKLLTGDYLSYIILLYLCENIQIQTLRYPPKADGFGIMAGL